MQTKKTAVIGFIAAAFIAILGGVSEVASEKWWDPATTWSAKAYEATVMFLVHPIPVPVWDAALVSVIVGFVVFGLIQAIPPRQSAPYVPGDHIDIKLGEGETQIVRYLAANPGEAMSRDMMAGHFDKKSLVVEQDLERLLLRGLIGAREDYLHGALFGLTRFGRDLAIQEQWV